MNNIENNKIKKNCLTCEFCFYNKNKDYICNSANSELGAYGSKIYDFKKYRSCWYIGYYEYIRLKKIK